MLAEKKKLKVTRIMFIVGIVLLVIAIVLFIIKAATGVTLDENGMLVENFSLLPITFVCLIAAELLFFASGLRSAILMRANSTNEIGQKSKVIAITTCVLIVLVLIGFVLLIISNQ